MCVRYVRAKGSVSRQEMRRLALRDALAAHGLPLGGSERAWASMPHDGMRVLAHLVGPDQSVAMGNESAGGALQRLEASMRNAASLVSPCFSNGVLALNRCAPPQEVPSRSSASGHAAPVGPSLGTARRGRRDFLTEGPPPLYSQTGRR